MSASKMQEAIETLKRVRECAVRAQSKHEDDLRKLPSLLYAIRGEAARVEYSLLSALISIAKALDENKPEPGTYTIDRRLHPENHTYVESIDSGWKGRCAHCGKLREEHKR